MEREIVIVREKRSGNCVLWGGGGGEKRKKFQFLPGETHLTSVGLSQGRFIPLSLPKREQQEPAKGICFCISSVNPFIILS